LERADYLHLRVEIGEVKCDSLYRQAPRNAEGRGEEDKTGLRSMGTGHRHDYRKYYFLCPSDLPVKALRCSELFVSAYKITFKKTG